LPTHELKRSRGLDGVAVLDGLAAQSLMRLAAECKWRVLDAHATILDAETESTEVYFLTEGRVRVTIYAPGGREVAFRDLDAGASFGEVAAVDGLGRSASVVALEPSVVATMSSTRFWRLLASEPPVAANVLRRFAALIRDLTARVVETTTLTVPERVRAEILRHTRVAGVVANSATIEAFPTHAELANQIGGTREAVTRELGHLTREGLIERRGRALVVPDVASLAAVMLDHR